MEEHIKEVLLKNMTDIRREDLLEKAPFDNYDIMTLFGENIATIVNIVNVIHNCVSVAA